MLNHYYNRSFSSHQQQMTHHRIHVDPFRMATLSFEYSKFCRTWAPNICTEPKATFSKSLQKIWPKISLHKPLFGHHFQRLTHQDCGTGAKSSIVNVCFAKIPPVMWDQEDTSLAQPPLQTYITDQQRWWALECLSHWNGMNDQLSTNSWKCTALGSAKERSCCRFTLLSARIRYNSVQNYCFVPVIYECVFETHLTLLSSQ